jgi:Flp pilus assembly protein TadG
MKWINEKGAAVVEFAVVLPLLLLIVFGIVEFSFLLYNQAMLTNAAREGARYGITISPRKTDTEIKDVVRSYCENYLVTFKSGSPTPLAPIVKVNGSEANPADGMTSVEDRVTVEVTYDYDFLILPSFITTLGVKKTLFASATMRAE